MPKRGLTFRDVRKIALDLPEAEESTSWGSPSLKVAGRMFACMATHRSADKNSLIVVLSDYEQRDAIIADDPDTYYVRDHYLGSPCVLVRLSRVHPDALRDLLRGAWKTVKRKNRNSRRPRRRRGGLPDR